MIRSEPLEVNQDNSNHLTHLAGKFPADFGNDEQKKLTLGNVESDPYLASAIEFMYSEDTEDDFNTLGRKQQEELLKKTWMEREKQFYGEEIDDGDTALQFNHNKIIQE